MKSVPDRAQPVVEAVAAAQRRHGLFPAPRAGQSSVPVVVGLSGGADSVCLVHVLWMLASIWKLTLHAAHVDHGLRAESVMDAEFAAELANSLGIEFHIRQVNGQDLLSDERGVEAAARAVRYAYLVDIATSTQSTQVPPIVAVAHHMNDQAETVLMNLLRGSGLRGMGGMPWVRVLGKSDGTSEADSEYANGVRLVRPLLGVRRSQVFEYLRAFDLSHREDVTNYDKSRLRNTIRHEILPALADINPQIVETLARTAQVLGAEAERAGELDRQALAGITVDASPYQRCVLDHEGLERLPLAAQRSVLRLACEQMGLDLREVGYETIDSLLRHVQGSDAASGPHSLSADVMWTVHAASGESPALLCIHRHDALPVRPLHPHLTDLREGFLLPCPLPCPGLVHVTDEWSLRSDYCLVEELPPGWRESGHPWRAFLDAERVRAPVLTSPDNGMKISPLGMSGHHKHLGDFFTDRKTPAALRPAWPIIVDSETGRVVWVCGHTIAHEARICAGTQRVLCLEWLRTPSSDLTPGLDGSRLTANSTGMEREGTTHAR